MKHVSELSLKLPSIYKEYGIEGHSIAPTRNFKIVEEKLLKYELAHV